jgi:biotin-(acetyl-CoA carboxylase) ligase
MPARSPALDLPPPFRSLRLREVGDAFAHAVAHAAELGAGTLVFVGRFDLAEFAIVLEPEEPLANARRCFYAGMSALADALAALAPPETPVAIGWPDALEIDRGLVGGGRFAWPRHTDEDAVPDWLVFGAMIRLVCLRSGADAHPQATGLAEEGFGLIDVERLAEGFARHLMLALGRWQNGEAAEIVQEYAARLRRHRDVRLAIEAGGDLRLERPGKPAEHRELAAALATPSWLGPTTGEPRLGLGLVAAS